MIKINAMGDTCPIPVVKTKNAIKDMEGSGQVEILVDNEIAVQNLTKMAVQKNYGVVSEKLEEQKYRVVMTVGEADASEEIETVSEAHVYRMPVKIRLSLFPQIRWAAAMVNWEEF